MDATAQAPLETVVGRAELVSEEGHTLPSVSLGDGRSTMQKADVEGLLLPSGDGRTTISYSHGLFYRLHDDEADQIPDGGFVVRGRSMPMAFRVRGRRPADRNADGSPIGDGGTWEGWTLVRLEPARCRPSEAL